MISYEILINKNNSNWKIKKPISFKRKFIFHYSIEYPSMIA